MGVADAKPVSWLYTSDQLARVIVNLAGFLPIGAALAEDVQDCIDWAKERAKLTHMSEECDSCGEVEEGDCPQSQRPCGHHCNHTWSHDECCWCGKVFGEE